MQDGRHRHPDLREYISELTTLLRRQCPPHLARIGGTATRQRVSRFASNQALCFPRRRIVDGQCPLMANVGFGCSRSDGRWDRDLCGGRAVAKAGRENPVGNATCATERFAQVDIPTDSAPATCTGRHSDRQAPHPVALRPGPFAPHAPHRGPRPRPFSMPSFSGARHQSSCDYEASWGAYYAFYAII